MFTTVRLDVRDWRDDEADRMLSMYSKAVVVRFLGSPPRPMATLDEAHERVARATARNDEDRAAGSPCGWWAVEVRQTGLVAGTVALTPVGRSREVDAPVEVAWALHPDSQGRGYATEAGRAALSRGHGAGIREILALTDEKNTASQAVCRRLQLDHLGSTSDYYDRPLMVWRST